MVVRVANGGTPASAAGTLQIVHDSERFRYALSPEAPSGVKLPSGAQLTGQSQGVIDVALDAIAPGESREVRVALVVEPLGAPADVSFSARVTAPGDIQPGNDASEAKLPIAP
jgi:hypothetical protein